LIVLALVALGVPERPSDRATGRPDRYEYAQVHMGLPVRLHLYAADEQIARAAATAAFARIAELDRMMSDYRPDSDVRRLSSDGTWTAVSVELIAVLRCALAVARATDGAFDPTIAPLVALWRDARRLQRLPDRADLDAARARVGWRHLQIDGRRGAVRFTRRGMRLDLGGIAKGYILQDALRVLRGHGIASALLEAGGDIVAGDAPPERDGWTIDAGGADADFAARAARLRNAALATSGPTAQYVDVDGARYSHVIDPRTGYGVTRDVVVRVIASDAAMADALATAVGVMGSIDARLRSRFPGATVSVARR
jgi:thiamine biosynthesis lipoprotein